MSDGTLSLLAFGDMMIEAPLCQNPMYDLIGEHDLSFANLEGALTDHQRAADKLVTLKAPPSAARQLDQLGLSVVSLANNHMLDYGNEGLRQTKTLLDNTSIQSVGAGNNLEEALQPVFIEQNDICVGFLAFASTLPIGFAAAEDRPGVAPIRVQTAHLLDAAVAEEQPGTSPYVSTTVVEGDLQRAVETIKATKRHCDLLIAALHWGVPEGWVAPVQGPLAEYQQPLGRALIDAGVDVIVGHHPHVVHGVEIYKNRPIFYSLGNFTAHPFAKGRKIELNRPLAGFQFDASGFELSDHENIPEHGKAIAVCLRLRKNQQAPIKAIEVIPFTLDHRGEPQLPSERDAKAILKRAQQHSQPFGTRMTLQRNHRGKIKLNHDG